ncbi:MAG: glycosyltransferase [Phycisphaerae bacterium]|nr:glycosyltransferase [Phycisphaerae bacterium]
MKILHVVQSLDPSWGGIARVLPALASELASAGEECRIATLSGARFGTAPDVHAVEVLRFAPNKNCRLGRSREFSRRIPSLVRDADVVHLHGLWTGQNWAAGKAARRIGRPYIMTPHSMMMPWAWQRSRWKKRPVGWLFEHKNLRRAARLHALAEGEAEHMRTLGFNDHIEVIANGVHAHDYVELPSADGLIARFPGLEGYKWVLFLGRIHPQKGISQLMQACFDVLAAAVNWHLVLVGPDEVGLQSTLQAAVARKGLSDRVTFTGMLNRQDVLVCLGRAKLLLQPSMSEGLSMSIIEALACGVPVVISTACNMPEVESRNAGRVVEPNRSDIAKALRGLIAMDDVSLADMGRRGQELVRERFDWSVLIAKYRRMYANVVKE